MSNQIRVGSVIHGYGQIVQEHPKVAPCKSMCRGCRDDFYNHSDLAPDGCWSFRSARVVDKIGYSSRHTTGGMDTRKVKTLDCWHGVN